MAYSSPLTDYPTSPLALASLSSFNRSETPLYDMTTRPNGFIATRRFAAPCDYCSKNGFTCCEATIPTSLKCEACRIRKRPCMMGQEPVWAPGPRVWSHPQARLIGYEAPEFGTPTEESATTSNRSSKYSILSLELLDY